MVVLGVDPGINGAACACFSEANGEAIFVADVIDLPAIEDGTKRQIDVVAFAAWVRGTKAVTAGIENVQPMMGRGARVEQGGTSSPMMGSASFRFGMVVGQIRATLLLSGVGFRKVVPQVWKRHFGLKGSDKTASLEMARKLHPEAAEWLQRKKDDGRAEAILIAHYHDAMLREARQ